METGTQDTKNDQEPKQSPPAAGPLAVDGILPPNVAPENSWQAALAQLPKNAGIV